MDDPHELVIALPKDAAPRDWSERIRRAKEVREAARKAREGKSASFASGRSLRAR